MNLKLFIFTIGLIGLFSFSENQSCYDFYKSDKCKCINPQIYKLASISRGYNIPVNKSITYEIVLYGGSEIIIQCCTEDDYYPVRFKLRSSNNGNIIYDNKYNNYLDNINLLLDHTELISVEINVEPKKKKLLSEGNKACIGMAVYFEQLNSDK